MDRKTYYLGVDSVNTAVDVIDTLSFFTVLDRKKAQIQCARQDRMSVGILPVEDPGGAVLFITGAFTPEEAGEIEDLADHEYELLRKKVSNVAAQTAVDMQKKGLSIPQQILGKAE